MPLFMAAQAGFWRSCLIIFFLLVKNQASQLNMQINHINILIMKATILDTHGRRSLILHINLIILKKSIISSLISPFFYHFHRPLNFTKSKFELPMKKIAIGNRVIERSTWRAINFKMLVDRKLMKIFFQPLQWAKSLLSTFSCLVRKELRPSHHNWSRAGLGVL